MQGMTQYLQLMRQIIDRLWFVQLFLPVIPTAIQPKEVPIILLLRANNNSNPFSAPFTSSCNVAPTFFDRRSLLTVRD
jgi:hypothetical protein